MMIQLELLVAGKGHTQLPPSNSILFLLPEMVIASVTVETVLWGRKAGTGCLRKATMCTAQPDAWDDGMLCILYSVISLHC